MPLRICSSQNCFERNLKQELKTKPLKQSLAIAYSVQRKAKAKKKK
jgi:hypothetical protein